ncbi:MAG: hypothetical protein Phog2KO_23390 [Phototrophicaceae bacterium]
MTSAIAGFFQVFEDPYKVYLNTISENELPDSKLLLESIQSLGYDIHLSGKLPSPLNDSFKGWLIVPIAFKGKQAGIFCLLFSDDMSLSEDASSILLSMMDSLAIVTASEKTLAHHQKVTDNQNEFVRIVSHDLRSPLTSIKGFASMLESSSEDVQTVHFAEKILNGVTQMTSLVDNIQDAGRYDPETGFYEMERSPVDLIEMVHRIVRTHLLPAEKQDLTLKVSTSDNIPIVNVDMNMLERSIINLVDNAIKYTPNGGEIEVGLNKQGNDLLITISDNGYGISEENIRQLFERNFRIRRREHYSVKGSGLGLFIVRSVAQHHSGEAFVESVEGEGSTFGIRIPLEGENLLGGMASV